MNAQGTVFRYNDNVDTDVIIPARYLNTIDPAELASHCMEDIDATFVKRVKKGDIIVAAKNFGCGSSREHAPIAIKAAGISCVIAQNFARIFYRNAINIGLPILECPAAAQDIKEGDDIDVDLATGHAAAGGEEIGIRFYGTSFIAGQTGALLAEASRDREEVVVATVDLDAARYHREDWSFFRDRRPELYRSLLSIDGEG